MKNIADKITEAKENNNLCAEVQNEVGKGGEYHTYSFSNGDKAFKKGFIYINTNDDFFGIQGLNTSKEYEDFVNVEEGSYAELDDLKVGQSTEIDECTIIRVW